MTISRRDRIQPLFNYLLCRCRQMDCLTEDDECDEHSSMDNFASSITQMLSTGKKKREGESANEKNKKLEHVITAVSFFCIC